MVSTIQIVGGFHGFELLLDRDVIGIFDRNPSQSVRNPSTWFKLGVIGADGREGIFARGIPAANQGSCSARMR
jgi:hypothetical protein